MDDLRNFNSRKLYEKLSLPDQEFEGWLKNLGLLYRDRICDCGGAMSYQWIAGRNYPKWRCVRKICRKSVGYLKGTWFEGAHLSLKDIFQLSYYFCRQTHNYNEIMFDMQRDDGSVIGSEAINEWMNYYRCAIAQYFVTNPLKIGGPGIVVEIDETVITKRKYNRGALRAEEQWYFGGVERGSNRCFICPVDRRDAATLLPIIQLFILPGTIIMSDKWAAYNRIDQLPELYEHYSVNHSENFVDPDTGAHTQTIEGTWSQFKRRHKEDMGTARSHFLSYIYLFSWKRNFSGEDAMYHLWEQIKKQYPLT